MNKVNKSVVDGTQVHCHLHVPITPPKVPHNAMEEMDPKQTEKIEQTGTPEPNPETTAANVEPVKPILDDSIAIGAAEAKAIAKKLEKQDKPAIPGLPEAERLKNKDRKPRNRVRTKKKKNENKKEESGELKSKDFLKNPNLSKDNPKLEDTYNFSEYSDDADDYEDSLEAIDDPKANPFETPLKFKSAFGRDQLERSLSRKRGHDSPSESETEPARPKSKSRLTSTPNGASSLLASKLPLLKQK